MTEQHTFTDLTPSQVDYLAENHGATNWDKVAGRAVVEVESLDELTMLEDAIASID